MTTLVLGASPDASRYSNMAINRLRQYGHQVVAFGPRKGDVAGVPITQLFPISGVDTVTLYIGPERQAEYYEKVVALRPRRVIFNPGTENSEFMRLLRDAQIEVDVACTLVMLGSGTY